MLDVIKDAHAKRYKAPEGDSNKDSILISDAWMAELTKHPYFSSKIFRLIIYRETRNWHLSDEGEGQNPPRAQEQDSASHLKETFIPDKFSGGSKARCKSARKTKESRWRPVSGNKQPAD
jgi:hypothetical protein